MNKKLLLIPFITLALCISVNSQSKIKPKHRTLPANTAISAGDYPDDFLKNTTVKSRLKKLLGKNYASFFDSFETQSPFEKKGNFLFSSGCLIHACTHLESAIAIDLVNKTIHLAIFRQNKAAKYFNEDNRKTPAVLTAWFGNLAELNK